MVIKILFTLFLAVSLNAQMLLLDKVRSLVGEETYKQNQAFIRIIFENESHFNTQGRIDVVRVVETLRENGLLTLLFRHPKTLQLTFETNGTPQFFTALMSNTLRDMGYYHYLTDFAQMNNSGYVWRITMESEYATDPAALQRELARRGCSVLDIERKDEAHWRYLIDMSGAHLRLSPLEPGKKVTMKRLVYPRWLDVSNAKKLTLWSLKGNNWYPYIAFYDHDLRLLKLYKRDKRSWQIIMKLPRGCAYVKVADLYSRKNMNAGLSARVQ